MPAAVSERPPRNGPIILYFIPLKAFSSGLDDSAFSPSAVFAASAVWGVGVVFSGFTALDCRSGFACASTPMTVRKMRNEIAQNRRTVNEAFLRKLSRPISADLREDVNNLSMVIPPGLRCKRAAFADLGAC